MSRSVSEAGLAATVVLAGVASALHIGKLPVAIPVLQQTMGLSWMQAGFLLSVVQVAGMALGLPAGLLADRFGPRRVMLWGLCLLALSSAAGALAPTPDAMLVARAFEGAGFLLAVLPAPGLLRRCVTQPQALARSLGWWGAYMPLGTALALGLGGVSIEAVGWRWVWLGLGALALMAALALARQVPADAPAAPGAAAALGPRLRRTLGAPGPWLVALPFFLYSAQWLAVIGFLPALLAQAGYQGPVAGALTAAVAASNMLGNIGAGRWLARGARPGVLLAVAFLAMAVGALLAFGVREWPLLAYASVVLFSALGGMIPGTLFSVAVAVAPGEGTVSTTVGWMQQFSSLGQFLGPPVVAWVATRVGGWHYTGWVTASAALLGLVLAWRLQREWVAHRHPGHA